MIGGDYRGLGIVRSLGRRHVRAWVLEDDHRVAGASRYAERSLPWPAATEDQVPFLLDIADHFGLHCWTLMPTSDATTGLIARNYDVLSSRYRLTTPPWCVTQWALDKRRSYQLAARTEVPYPITHYPEDRTQVERLDLTFPVIIKPASREDSTPLTTTKAWRVDERQALLARFDEASRFTRRGEVMIQELIPDGGEQLSYAALCLQGVPLAWIAARRLRQYPMDFGRFSTAVESIDEPEVERAARRFLAATGYSGLIELEFKRDPRTGVAKLLDVNPRVWGWHSLGRRAGVDFPYLLWRLANGEEVEGGAGRPGVRWVRFSSDVAVSAREMMAGRLSIAGYLRTLRPPIEFAIFALDDPKPALVELMSLPGQVLRGASAGSNTTRREVAAAPEQTHHG